MGIHRVVYKRLVKYLGIERRGVQICDLMQQIVEVDEEVKQKLEVDVDGVFKYDPCCHGIEIQKEERDRSFVDEWGVKWHIL